MNASPTILFLHGLEARPGGFKPTFLKSQGFEVLNPALPDDDFGKAVSIAQAAFDDREPDIVVGSSRGGAVAMAIDSRTAPLVLIAPAWRFCGVQSVVKRETIILHSARDELIPLAHSQLLVDDNDLLPSNLRVIGDDHRMNDEQAMDALIAAIRELTT